MRKEEKKRGFGMIDHQKHTIKQDFKGRIGSRNRGVYAMLQTNGQRVPVQPVYKIGQSLGKHDYDNLLFILSIISFG